MCEQNGDRSKIAKVCTKIAKAYNKNNFEISFIGIETATYFHPIMNINSGIFIVIPCFMQHMLVVTKYLLANPVHFCQSTVSMSGWFEDFLYEANQQVYIDLSPMFLLSC